MPSSKTVRERICIALKHAETISRYQLLRRFNEYDRERAETEISRLLGEAFLVETGSGTRGSPIMLSRGLQWYKREKCPFCHQSIINSNLPLQGDK